MKNQIVLMLSAIVLCKTGFSQENKDSTATKAPVVEAITLLENPKKNELSIDLIPLIKMASMSEGAFNIKGTIQYKRHLKPNLFLRVGITAMKKEPQPRFDNISVHPSNGNYDRVIYRGYDFKPTLNLDAGLEYRWGKRRIKQFTGMDIGYVYKKQITRYYLAEVPRYSNYDPNNYYYSGSYQHNGPDSTHLYRDALITQKETTTGHGVVFTPFYGVQFHFSRRFFFSMQLGLQMQFLVTTYEREHYYGYIGLPATAKTFDFNLGENGILNNFSLGFRF